MTQPNTLNFVLTSPVHFETSGFDGKSGDVCVWRAPGQLVVYRAGALVGNFPLSHVSVAALRSESIFSLNAPPKHVDTSKLPALGDTIAAPKPIEEVVAPAQDAPIVAETQAPVVEAPAAPATDPETSGNEESPEEVETPEEAPAAEAAAPAAPKKSKKK